VKKIIFSLFVVQLLIIIFYGMIYLRSSNYHDLLFEDNSFIMIHFNDNNEEFEFFLNLVEEKELIASRIVWPDNETTFIYTTDVTLGNSISLKDGEFPTARTSEFISTVETGEVAQVGLIVDLVPGHEIMIADIHNPRNFGLDGFYQINTTDSTVMQSIVDELQARLLFVEWEETPEPSPLERFNNIFFSLALQGEFHTLQMQLIEFGIIFSIITLCLATSVIQFLLNKLKSSAVFLMQGYSKTKIILKFNKELIKLFLVATAIAYVILVSYLVYVGHLIFLSNMTRITIFASLGLILFYLGIGSGIACIALVKLKITTVLKGQKFDQKIQILNHLTKGAFTILFLLIFSISLTNLHQLNERLSGFSYWEKAQNVQRITVSAVAAFGESGANDVQKIAFYQDLLHYHQGFLMDSLGISSGDRIREEEQGRSSRFESHLLDGSNEVYISPSFLEFNPIYDVHGNPVINQLIDSDYILNVLVPHQFLNQEADIHRILLERFNGWRELLFMMEIPTEITPRELNMIWVADEQSYFSFDQTLRPESGNRVQDPIAIVHQGRFSNMFIPSALTHSVYFRSTTNDPFGEIESLIHEHGLQDQIQRIESVYSQNAHEIRALQNHQTRLLTLLSLLLIANLAVTYNLVANYFERSKFQIFLKSTFGWSLFKQNQRFLFSYLGYMFPLILISSIKGGGLILLMGISILILDIASMTLFQNKLLKKSFSEIMKGER